MLNCSVFVGLDYAESAVQVCVLDATGRQVVNRRCRNDWLAIDACVPRAGEQVRASIEACNGAANLAEELLQHAGWSIDLAHPGYVKRMKGNPDKTDYSDARLLADLVRVGYLPRVWLAPPAIRELRRLVRYRQDLVNRRRAIKQRVGALVRDHRLTQPEGCTWTQRWKRWLAAVPLPSQSRFIVTVSLEELHDMERRIATVEAELANVTAADGIVSRLRGIKGIGLVTACAIRAEVDDPRRFRNGRQLARFCGLTPRNASSGERQADAGLIHAGNRVLRTALIEAAHRLKRFDPHWAAFAQELRARGKPGSVIAAAVANRWVRRLFYDLLATQAA